MSTTILTPAQQLLGCALVGDWTVIEQLERPHSATGGYFSHGYIVQHKGGRRAYLKALDFTRALADDDPAQALEHMTTAFNYERAICERCKTRHLDRVVQIITHGKVKVMSEASAVVQYLIFELADGDVRFHLDTLAAFDLAWALRTLHHIAVGLNQLHGTGVAHQDLKPSNVLTFREEGSNLGDLGRSVSRDGSSPFNSYECAGDRGYAPPELLYGEAASDWDRHRLACDAYLLGSMIVYFFSRSSMTAMITSRLVASQRCGNWPDGYERVLPYIRDAFGDAVLAVAKDIPLDVRPQLVEAIRQLCEPDPRLRGHPRNRQENLNQYSLERYISEFHLLAEKAEYRLLRK
jgi:eukaryotic-like serine/threonine-protein kinase